MSPARIRSVETTSAEADLHAEIDRLLRRNADLERISQELERFAFAASHDLREPLRMITTYAQLFVHKYGTSLDVDAVTCLGNIVDAATRMSELISDLMAYNDIAMNPERPAEPVDLNVVVENVKDNLKNAIGETHALIVSEDLPVVAAHRTDFISLFQNLVANGIKYRGESAPRIHISVEHGDGEWRFSVEDHGIGIEPAYHRQIFEPFKRLSGRNIPGTGLGLTICQRVVNRYSGRIWVESQAGQGATFVFTLPEGKVRLMPSEKR